MKNIILIEPKLEDLWFREECMSDPDTMNYNAGYDVSYEGYHYDTGCIDFPKSKWENWLENNKKKTHFYYAYIKDVDTNEFIGYVNFNLISDGEYSMGIVIHSKYQGQGYMRPSMTKFIEEAKKQGVKKLCDSVPASREKALKVFFDLGFKIEKEYISIKFNKEDLCYDIVKEL